MTSLPCKHLEKLLQPPKSESVKAIPSEKIDKFYYESGAGFIIPPEIRDRTFELDFRDRLAKSGLPEAKIDILVCKFVYDMGSAEIAKELNFVSPTTVLRMLGESLKYLKKIGFSR